MLRSKKQSKSELVPRACILTVIISVNVICEACHTNSTAKDPELINAECLSKYDNQNTDIPINTIIINKIYTK